MTASAPETFMVLKKNQALNNGVKIGVVVSQIEVDVPMLDDPLHDTKVVHHLYKGDEEDDSAKNIDEEPVLVDGVLIEEEGCTDLGLLQEVRDEKRKPLEEFEAGISLKDEEGDSLLEKETDNDRLPTNEFKSRSLIISMIQRDLTCQSERGSPWDLGAFVGG